MTPYRAQGDVPKWSKGEVCKTSHPVFAAPEMSTLETRGPPESADVRHPERCPTCHCIIVKEAHGGEHPSAGDHDPAYHVAAAYGTTHPSLEVA